MRLTLRTLLAWLDTVLPPEEQRSLGQKVVASPVAPQLISRIREVVERGALSAPRPDGRGLADDPNSVAEYLDNTLAPDRLEAFERICIESDMHLAEVSACHGLLAEISREPDAVAPLDDAGRRRLLQAVGHHVTASPGEREPGTALGGGRGLPKTIAAASAGAGRAAAPQPRGKATLGAWLSALTALVLLVALGGFFVWSLGRGRGRATPAKPAADVAASAKPEPIAEPEPAVATDAVATDAVAAPPPQPDEQPAAPAVPAVAEKAAPPSAPPSAPPIPVAKPGGPVSAVPPAPAPRPAEPVVPPAPVQQRVPQGDALAIAAAPAVPPVNAPPRDETPRNEAEKKPTATATPEGAAAPAGAFVSGKPLLFHRLPNAPAVHGQTGWGGLATDAPLAEREDLLAPPGCRPEITVEGRTVRLEPNTRVTLGRDADGTPRLEVVFGRVTVRSTEADARLGINAGGLTGVIKEGLREPVGVEVRLERAAGADPAATATRTHAALTTTTAGLAWQQTERDGSPASQPLQGIETEGLLESRSHLVWDSSDPGFVAVQPVRRDDWIAAAPRADWLEQSAAAAVAAKVATVQPLEKGLRELAADKRVENRMAAAATLALLGEYDELVDLLCADADPRKLQDGQWTRLEALTVPLALARGANAAAKLTRALEDRGGPELVALACGFSDGDLAAGADGRLVEALDAESLVVRRYAIKNLTEIVEPAEADRSRYRPDRPKDLRDDGVDWWRRAREQGRVRRPGAADPAAAGEGATR